MYNYAEVIIMMHMDLKIAGIVSNRHKDIDFKGAKQVAGVLRQRGIDVCFDSSGMPDGETDVLDYEKVGCVFVLGGDGTILKAAATACTYSVPMLGINLGRLGFLTEVELGGIEGAVDRILSGDYYIEKRLMLHGSILEHGNIVQEGNALNEIAVVKKDTGRMIDIELVINGELADKMPCDGMLISTPTGSTGYALSAGGPIVCPRLECIIAAPICAHTLHSKTIVASPHDTIILKASAPYGVMLTADGVVLHEIEDGEIIKVKRSTYSAHFIRFTEGYFYPLLRSKFLNWDR